MTKADSALIRADDIATALMLLTRLPMPFLNGAPRGAFAAWAWPLAGAVVGCFAVFFGVCAALLGLPEAVVAGVVLVTLTMLTGGLHEDGLADVADGFWGGATRDRRLEIMRDSRIGSYGVIALVLSLGLRWVAFTSLIAAGAWGAIVAASVLSRVPMAVMMRGLGPARMDGLSRSVGRPSGKTALLGVAVGFGAALGLTGWAAIVSLCAVGIVTLGLALLARRKIGGQTGDVVGALQQVSEIVVLCVFLVVFDGAA